MKFKSVRLRTLAISCQLAAKPPGFHRCFDTGQLQIKYRQVLKCASKKTQIPRDARRYDLRQCIDTGTPE